MKGDELRKPWHNRNRTLKSQNPPALVGLTREQWSRSIGINLSAFRPDRRATRRRLG